MGISSSGAPSAESARPVLNRYCVGCHNERLRTAGLALDTMGPARVGDADERGPGRSARGAASRFGTTSRWTPSTRCGSCCSGTRYARQGKLFALDMAWTGATPYFLAAKFGRGDLMRQLAEHGADPHAGLTGGVTPLMAAAGMLTRGFGRAGKDRLGREMDSAEMEVALTQDPDRRGVMGSGIEAVKVSVDPQPDRLQRHPYRGSAAGAGRDRLGRRQPSSSQRGEPSHPIFRPGVAVRTAARTPRRATVVARVCPTKPVRCYARTAGGESA